MERQWYIDDEARRSLLQRIIHIALNADERTSVKAFRAIVESQKIDLQAAQVAVNATVVAKLEHNVNDQELIEGVIKLLEQSTAPHDNASHVRGSDSASLVGPLEINDEVA